MDAARLKELNESLMRVSVRFDGVDVGTLATTPEGLLAFEYADTWLKDGFSISPLSLPLRKGLFVAKREPLGGVFGVFDDSLPDGWGRLLVDRMLRSLGLDPAEVGPLLRLSIVGTSGMGALEYVPETPLPLENSLADLDAVAEECARVLKTDYSDDLDALFAMGGSSGGARPKILTQVDGAEWIIKFPSSYDSPDIGKEEYEIAQLAQECGIEMPRTRLFPSKKCAGYFGVQRFDRVYAEGSVRKVHMASAGALLETSHRIPNLDYALLMKLTVRLGGDDRDLSQLYKLMCFNVFIGNRDDHAKNFTFLHDGGIDGSDCWRLSPGYDLTRSAGLNGEQFTTVNGKGKSIEVDDLVRVGVDAGLPVAQCRWVAQEIEALTSQYGRAQ